MEDYSERPSRWAVSVWKCPRTELLLAVPWVFHSGWHFQVISQGDIFEEPSDCAGMCKSGTASGWGRREGTEVAGREWNSREAYWTGWPLPVESKISLYFQRNFGVLAREGQPGESLLLSWGWETATLCSHRILEVFRKFATIDVFIPSLFIFFELHN